MPKPGSWILPAFATAWSPMPLPLGMWLLAGPLKVVQGGLWTCFWRGSGSWQRVFRYYSSSSGTTAVPQGFRFLRYYISSSGIQVPQVLQQFLRDSGSSGTISVPQGLTPAVLVGLCCWVWARRRQTEPTLLVTLAQYTVPLPHGTSQPLPHGTSQPLPHGTTVFVLEPLTVSRSRLVT